MVANATSLTGNGLRDWLLQRVSAIVLALYVLFFIGFYFIHGPVDYAQWKQLFNCSWMRVASAVVLLNLIIHAWVGIWTITTDYLKATCIRLFVQFVVFIALLGVFFWGIEIFWGL